MTTQDHQSKQSKHSEHYEVVVLGAGLSGVCAAIKLKEAGIERVRVFEKASDVGGTWRDNRYPGVACDVPSHLYSYSFAPNPDWSRWYAPGREIWDYVRRCATDFGVYDNITFDTTIVSATWTSDRWTLQDSHGATHTATSIISALGGLHTPNMPDLPGHGTYQGVTFHTTNWPDDLDLSDKRVAVIGTGATAVQIVPEIAETAAELIVFQRSPVWVGPKREDEYTEAEREEFRNNPEAMRSLRQELWDSWEFASVELHREGTEINKTAEAKARRMIEQSVSSPEVARALTPDHNFSCKRPTISNRYYSTFDKPNVLLATGGVEALTSTGLVCAGHHYEADVIIFATGFKPFNVTNEIELTGVDGLSLGDAWHDEITSYKSVMVSKFPNLFFLMGPNGTGLQSALQTVEPAVDFAVGAIGQIRAGTIAALSPTQEAVDAFTRNVRERFENTTHSKGCTSWWSEGNGHNHSIWPGDSTEFRELLTTLDLADFDITRS